MSHLSHCFYNCGPFFNYDSFSPPQPAILQAPSPQRVADPSASLQHRFGSDASALSFSTAPSIGRLPVDHGQFDECKGDASHQTIDGRKSSAMAAAAMAATMTATQTVDGDTVMVSHWRLAYLPQLWFLLACLPQLWLSSIAVPNAAVCSSSHVLLSHVRTSALSRFLVFRAAPRGITLLPMRPLLPTA